MPLKFSRRTISSEAFESAGVFDVDGDGVLDIVSGEFWYQGPDFRKRHRIGNVRRVGEYYDDFSTIAMDVNGDGRMDFITGGMWGETLVWRENPGADGQEWSAHVIGKCGGIESTRAWDIDGDGQLEIVPNTPNFPLTAYKLLPGGRFSAHTLFPKAHGHGLGFGDIDGDGRGDLVFCNGWLQAPARGLPSHLEGPLNDDWIFHPEFDLGCASVPIIVADVNGDGVNDLIVGQAHGYGLDWWEQKREAGRRQWIRHPIDPFNSQYHDMQWADIDGDGKCELITGKRFRAHNGRDPGEFDDVGIYYFKWNGESFSKQIVAYGPPGVGKGCGIHFALADLRGTGRLDIVAPGKDGLCVFYNGGL
jgi:hypothetical protein